MHRIVQPPEVHVLGHQGEYFHIKVTWRVLETIKEDPAAAVPLYRDIGSHGLVLKMRAEDLPMHLPSTQLLHFDVGHAWSAENEET